MKGMPIEECVNRAEKFISKNKICLLLFDVKNSGGFADKQKLFYDLFEMEKDFNKRFDKYLPENKLANPSRKEKGFSFALGDGSWAGINSKEAVKEIIDYQRENYPDIPLYWSIAKDRFDEEGIEIVR
jgi:hypothetical protein